MGAWFELNGPLLGLALLDGIASAALVFMVAVGLSNSSPGKAAASCTSEGQLPPLACVALA